MVNDKDQLVSESDVPFRRRGRPAGKNRIPLSKEERRARNAQYERERRNETAEAMSQLVEAVSCDPSISNAELLATVISRIQQASRNTENIADLERVNAKLEAQIITLQSRLGLDDESFALLDSENNDQNTILPQPSSKMNSKKSNRSKKRKRSEWLGSEHIQREKRIKTESETCSVDSGISVSTPPPVPSPCPQDNIQYLIHNEQQLPGVEISQDQSHDDCRFHNIELQSELYNEIYNSEAPSSELTVACDARAVTLTQTMPCMETLYRSLITVPSIKPPQAQQDSPDVRVEHNTQPDLISPQNTEPACDLNDINLSDFLQQNEDLPTLDFLTDSEKYLLTDWMGADGLETS